MTNNKLISFIQNFCYYSLICVSCQRQKQSSLSKDEYNTVKLRVKYMSYYFSVCYFKSMFRSLLR